jgi:hypothetical protein
VYSQLNAANQFNQSPGLLSSPETLAISPSNDQSALAEPIPQQPTSIQQDANPVTLLPQTSALKPNLKPNFNVTKFFTPPVISQANPTGPVPTESATSGPPDTASAKQIGTEKSEVSSSPAPASSVFKPAFAIRSVAQTGTTLAPSVPQNFNVLATQNNTLSKNTETKTVDQPKESKAYVTTSVGKGYQPSTTNAAPRRGTWRQKAAQRTIEVNNDPEAEEVLEE